MENIKIFRIEAEQTCTAQSLVMAKNKDEAKFIFDKAVRNGEIEFDKPLKDIVDITMCQHLTSMGKDIVREVKDYGVLNEKSELIYNGEIIEEIIKLNKKHEHEEWLKKHHLEFKFE